MRHKKYKSLRLKDYDYSQPGAYFITICTYKRYNFFGDIKDDTMILSTEGIIAVNEIKGISRHYENVEVGEYVVMPNHVHMVIFIYDMMNFNKPNEKEINSKDKQAPQDLNNCVRQAMAPANNPRLQDIVGSYKSAVTRECGKSGIKKIFRWQRYFHDHIIRNDKALEYICDYIRLNPAKWSEDIKNHKYLSRITEAERKNKAHKIYQNLTN